MRKLNEKYINKPKNAKILSLNKFEVKLASIGRKHENNNNNAVAVIFIKYKNKIDS